MEGGGRVGGGFIDNQQVAEGHYPQHLTQRPVGYTGHSRIDGGGGGGGGGGGFIDKQRMNVGGGGGGRFIQS